MVMQNMIAGEPGQAQCICTGRRLPMPAGMTYCF